MHQLRLLAHGALPRQTGRLARETALDYVLVFQARWTFDEIDRAEREHPGRLDRVLAFKALIDERRAAAMGGDEDGEG